MLSKNKIKWVNSLKLKKNRDAERVVVAEGGKIVSELLPVLRCRFLAHTPDVHLDNLLQYADEIVEITEEQYRKITFQKSPQGVLAVFEQSSCEYDVDKLTDSLSLALDNIQDPGNLGTIVRTADWFGVKDIFCSPDTADIYNPKVVQATMGAIARVRVHYVDLRHFLEEIKSKMPVYGTLMDGENIYQKPLGNKGVLLMGNEGKGISESLIPLISDKLLVPPYPSDSAGSESLNVSIATALCLAEFRRRAK